MKKPTLTKEESDIYITVVKNGTIDDMFDFGYAIGRARLAEEMLHDQQKMLDGFGHPKDCAVCEREEIAPNNNQTTL